MAKSVEPITFGVYELLEVFRSSKLDHQGLLFQEIPLRIGFRLSTGEDMVSKHRRYIHDSNDINLFLITQVPQSLTDIIIHFGINSPAVHAVSVFIYHFTKVREFFGLLLDNV
jgi:hypothetical protein